MYSICLCEGAGYEISMVAAHPSLQTLFSHVCGTIRSAITCSAVNLWRNPTPTQAEGTIQGA